MTESFIQLPRDGDGKKTRTNLINSGGVDVHQQVVQLSNSSGVEIVPATAQQITSLPTAIDNESIWLLRRIVKLLESNAVVDSFGRQKVILEGTMSNSMGVGVSLIGNPIQVAAPYTTGTGYVQYVWEGPVDQRWRVIDAARTMYAVGIRSNLIFS